MLKEIKIMVLSIFVKKQTTRDGKDFRVASYVSPKGIWYKVKFTQDCSINLTKLSTGYYDLGFDNDFSSIQTKNIKLKNDTDFVEKILWVSDPKATLTPHKETAEEKEAKTKRIVNELTGE